MSDNGVGMEPARAVAVLVRAGQAASGSSNVQARLQDAFGPAYGLEIAALPDEGTTVTMTCPSSAPASARHDDRRRRGMTTADGDRTRRRCAPRARN